MTDTTTERPDWTELRRDHIGGSDIAHLFDHVLDEPYLSQYDLARKKLGYVTEPTATTERMKWGNRHEPAVIQAVRDDWHLDAIGWQDVDTSTLPLPRDVLITTCKPEPAYPNGRAFLSIPDHLGGTPDGIVRARNGRHVLLEVKTVDADAHRYWAGELPAAYVLQIQTYLGLTGLSRCIVAALVGGNTLVRYDIEAESETFELLRTTAAIWHAAYIQTATLPEARPAKDARGVFDYWAYRAEPASSADYSDDGDARALLDRYREAKADLEHAETELDAAKAELLAYTAGFEKVTITDWTISIVRVKPNSGRYITDADVGTYIGAKDGNTQIRVTQKKPKTPKAGA